MVTKEERLEIYQCLCKQGFTTNEIAEKMKVSKRTISNYAKELGVQPKSGKRKPNLNENFFENIDSEEKAYILGFIFADGYVDSNERGVTLNISVKDVDILYKIKHCINCKNELRVHGSGKYVKLHLSSKKLTKDLKKLGVLRNKSLILQFPTLREELYRHFLRGYFDGDGHIGTRQSALVIGSKAFLEGFDRLVFAKFGKTVYRNDMKNYTRVQFNRKDFEIIKWLYADSTIYLDRKYNMYNIHWSNYIPKG